jgi:hypothetical protein
MLSRGEFVLRVEHAFDALGAEKISNLLSFHIIAATSTSILLT